MPYTIKHAFVSTLADGTVATKVKPSNWNDSHQISGALAGNEITNIPAGAVTATDVQAAINQLASLIPAPGPGTDPLFLVNGLSTVVDNPSFNLDLTNRYGTHLGVNTDCRNTRPTSANNSTLWATMTATHGQNSNVVGSTAKQTFFAVAMSGLYNAAGQKFVQANNCFSYGMGDCGIHGNDYVQYSGGPVGGDEGQGWGLASALTQQPYLNTTTITAVPIQSVVNTTTTQVITQSKDPQTVTVVSTAGAVNGDWVVIGQELPTNNPNLEAVQIISFTPTSITAIFLYSHANGVTVTPALRLSCASTYQMGQDRVLVNMSQPSYSTGTVASISGGAFNGLGTAWANNMVGGYALNIGAISLAADDYTGLPFDAAANRLKSWYQILVVTNPTSLAIYRTDTAGDVSYHGKGPGTGAYIIRPCARVLRVMAVSGAATGELICETSTSTWTIGDTVEQVICPYADVIGFQYYMNHFANGGSLRSFLRIVNGGARTCEIGITFEGLGPIALGDPTADTVSFGTVLSIGASCDYGISCQTAQKGAMLFSSAAAGGGRTDTGNFIRWGVQPTTWGIGPNSTNLGLTINGAQGGGQPSADLRIAAAGQGINQDASNAEFNFGGHLKLINVNGIGSINGAGGQSYILIDNITDAVNFETSFLQWTSNVFGIGTRKGGSGNPRDLAIFTDNTERLRFPAAGGIKFTDAADFSANDGVATALTSVGPVGASTTVQKWLTIIDNTNVTRYIPCF